MVSVKNLKFCKRFVLCEIHREKELSLSKIDGEKVFADVLDKKEAFKDFKNNCL